MTRFILVAVALSACATVPPPSAADLDAVAKCDERIGYHMTTDPDCHAAEAAINDEPSCQRLGHRFSLACKE